MLADLRQARYFERIDALSAECGLGVLRRNRHLEEEQPQQGPEWCARQPAFLGGRVAALARVRVFAEQPMNRVFGIADASESCSEPLGRDGVCHEISVHHQSGIIMPESHGLHDAGSG